MNARHDFAREQHEADRGDAEAKEARILAEVKRWRCTREKDANGIGIECAVNLSRPMVGAFCVNCGAPAYNADDAEVAFTNSDGDANRRMHVLCKIESEADDSPADATGPTPKVARSTGPVAEVVASGPLLNGLRQLLLLNRHYRNSGIVRPIAGEELHAVCGLVEQLCQQAQGRAA